LHRFNDLIIDNKNFNSSPISIIKTGIRQKRPLLKYYKLISATLQKHITAIIKIYKSDI